MAEGKRKKEEKAKEGRRRWYRQWEAEEGPGKGKKRKERKKK